MTVLLKIDYNPFVKKCPAKAGRSLQQEEHPRRTGLSSRGKLSVAGELNGADLGKLFTGNPGGQRNIAILDNHFLSCL